MSSWRQEETLKRYKDAGLPTVDDAFQRYMDEWSQANEAMIQRRAEETKEDN